MARGSSTAIVNGVVGIPLADEMRVRAGWGCPSEFGADGLRRAHAFNPHKTEDAVVFFPAHFVGEQSEKEEDVTDRHAAPFEMTLGCGTLTEPALAAVKEWVIMAEICSRNPSARGSLDKIAQSEIAIAGPRSARGGDW